MKPITRTLKPAPGDPLPSTKTMFVVFEALRRMGWPAANIFFSNATDFRSKRQCAFVTLQDGPDSPAKFAYLVVPLVGRDGVPDALTDVQKHIEKWNKDEAFRDSVWKQRATLGFDDVKFVEVLVAKGLNVGPEKLS